MNIGTKHLPLVTAGVGTIVLIFLAGRFFRSPEPPEPFPLDPGKPAGIGSVPDPGPPAKPARLSDPQPARPPPAPMIPLGAGDGVAPPIPDPAPVRTGMSPPVATPRRASPTPASSVHPDIARARFTTGVRNREPDEALSSVSASVRKLYFFTEVINRPNTSITHRWIYRGRVMADVPLAVGGPRWRTWSSKNLLPSWTGTWTVQVLDASGAVMLEQQVQVGS